ncbi:MAG TPA: ABC transporter substrate-binding protein [Eoetvoesiella sp.]|uniref:ABC transporter substrate-binding protein n=1 Tax=Eoetvoesiella sp. TaxID=1966355 RepID=UPI002C3DD0F2|nr:ABC transporter substrate-binding protein [Eoetvoesiella sp.]HWK61369.1 ABC transporter substrate-binding protein [Eoetvoesiella sp.]
MSTSNSFHMTRRRLLQGALAAGAGLAFPQWSRAQQGGGRTLQLGYIGPSRNLVNPTGWSLASGGLTREIAALGYTGVTTHMFLNGPDLNEAFFSGALDVGIYGDTPSTVAKSRGLDARLVGFDQVGLDAWLLTPRGGGVTSVKDLEGKTVAVALGSYMHRYVLGLLKEAGILKTTNVVYMLPRDGAPALEKKSIAAFAAPIDNGPLLIAKGFPVLDQASWHPGLAGSSLIQVSGPALQRTPGLPAALLRSRQAAIKEIQADPEKYYAFHAKASGYPLEVIKASRSISQFPLEAYPADGIKLLNQVESFLLEQKLIRKPVDIAQWQVQGL